MSHVYLHKPRARLGDSVPPEPPKLPDAGPLIVPIKFPAGEGRTFSFSECPCQKVARVLAGALIEQTRIGSKTRTVITAAAYAGIIRKFTKYLAEKEGCGEDTDFGDLTGRHIDNFETTVRESKKPGSPDAYAVISGLVRLLRTVAASNAPAHESLKERLKYLSNGGVGDFTSYERRDAYTDFVASQIRQACIQDMPELLKRLQEGKRLLAEGQDPRIGGWENPANILWKINQRDILTYADFRALSGRKLRGRMSDGRSLKDLHRLLYPSASDLFPFLVMIALQSGIEIEICKKLKANCLKNERDGYVEIEGLKRRAPGHEYQTIRVLDGSMMTPGGIIRMVLEATSSIRERTKSDSLWLYYAPGEFHDRFSRMSGSEKYGTIGYSKWFSRRHKLKDDDGNPLLLDLTRLRKTKKAEFYRATEGVLDVFADRHTRVVAGDWYADIPALRSVHEETIAGGLTEAWKSAIEITVINSQEELLPAELNGGGSPELMVVRAMKKGAPAMVGAPWS